MLTDLNGVFKNAFGYVSLPLWLSSCRGTDITFALSSITLCPGLKAVSKTRSIELDCEINVNTISGGSKGAFFGKIWQICMLALSPGRLAPPPTGNPGSTPDHTKLSGGSRISKTGRGDNCWDWNKNPIIWQDLCRKLHENERNSTAGWREGDAYIPSEPHRSANETKYRIWHCIIFKMFFSVIPCKSNCLLKPFRK